MLRDEATCVNRPTVISFASRAFSGKVAETRSDSDNMLRALSRKDSKEQSLQPDYTIENYSTEQEEGILKV